MEIQNLSSFIAGDQELFQIHMAGTNIPMMVKMYVSDQTHHSSGKGKALLYWGSPVAERVSLEVGPTHGHKMFDKGASYGSVGKDDSLQMVVEQRCRSRR